MKHNPEEKEIFKRIVKEGVHPPDNDQFTRQVVDRFEQERISFAMGSYRPFNIPGVLMVLFAFLFIIISCITPFVDELTEQTGLYLVRALGRTLVELLYQSPFFLLIFAAMILLYLLDRFLTKQYSPGG